MQDAVTNGSRPHRRALVAAVALLVTAVAVLSATVLLSRARADRGRAQVLDRTLALEARWVRARLERLEAVAAELLATPRPPSRSSSARGETTSPPDRLGGFGRSRSLDLVAMFGPDGEELWAADGAPAVTRGGNELVELARRLAAATPAPGARSGLVAAGGLLRAVAQHTAPAEGETAPVTVVVAQRIDTAVVRELDQAIAGELAFVIHTDSGPALGAATLEPSLAPELPLALRRLQSWDSVRAEASALELDLQGVTWDTQLAPLYGLEGPSVGVAVALLPQRAGAGLGSLLLLETLLAAVALAALALVALPGPRALAQAAGGGEAPADLLAAALARASDGAGFVPPQLPAGYERLNERLAGVLQEQQRLRALVEVARRRGAVRFELSGSDAPLRVTVEELALLAVELRGLARSDTVKQPEAALIRARRDLERARHEIELRGGRVEAWLGHRLLASFGGERAVVEAVRAAAEIERALATTANAFEEPRPPVLALAWGAVAVGVGSEDEAAARALAGRPLQQLEEVVREAMVGDLLATKDVMTKAGAELAELGIAVREHAGLRTTQTLFAVDLGSVGNGAPGSATLGGEPARSAS